MKQTTGEHNKGWTNRASLRILGVSVVLMTFSFNTASAETRDDFEARVYKRASGDTLPYRLFIPRDYDPSKKYPLVLFFHGGGETGNDNTKQLRSPGATVWAEPENQAKHPCFVIAPQFPKRESGDNAPQRPRTAVMKTHIQATMKILDGIEAEFSIDTRREYVTGLSMGGESTWMALIEQPKRFAAAVTICAGDWIIGTDATERGKAFSQFPLWIFHGAKDKTVSVDVSRKVVQALKDAGGNPRYTEYPEAGHNSWVTAYADPELSVWLFAQSR